MAGEDTRAPASYSHVEISIKQIHHRETINMAVFQPIIKDIRK